MTVRMKGTQTVVSFSLRNVFYTSVFSFILCLNCVTFVEGKKRDTTAEDNTKNENTNQTTDAMDRLSRVFGIDSVPHHVFQKSPPQFMVELFKDITDSGGLIKKEGPYKANTIVSFPDRALNQQMHFYYNVSYIHPSERILEAEFHVFRMHTSRNSTSISKRSVRQTHFLEIKVYQVLNPANMQSPSGKRLLDVQRVSVHVRGWMIFNVTKAVRAWTNTSETNHGLLVTTTTLYGQDMGESAVRFAQRRQHHESKQPILVVYTDDGRKRSHNYISPEDDEYKQIKRDIEKRERKLERKRRKKDKYNQDNTNMQTAIRFLNEREREEYGHPFFKSPINTGHNLSRRRRNVASVLQEAGEKPRNKKSRKRKTRRKKDKKGKRDVDFRYMRQRRTCSKLQMYVDFDEIGWAGWIISPKGYNAYHCKGECPFPLGQSQKPTNHATVQSIVHALRVGKDVSTPCCVPNKLYSISLLYFDDAENVILKQYDDMVAASCGCH